jgi:abequosyltransferase
MGERIRDLPVRGGEHRRLTIAIPTYNRAALLDRQLAWLAQAIQGEESRCEVLISDNASTDATLDVIAKWLASFASTTLQVRVNRHDHNLGPIRNIAYLTEQARGEFLWTISDDDAIGGDTLRFVLQQIEEHPDLQSLILNFSARHHATGRLSYAHCFEIDADWFADPGSAIVEWALHHPSASRWGGLVLTTAQVYRTVTAQAAVRAWPGGVDNLYLQFFVTAYCAQRGKTMLTKGAMLEMAGGRAFFSGDERLLFGFKLVGMPEALVQVATLGYPPALCLEKIAIERKRLGNRRIIRSLLREPIGTVRLLRRHRAAVRSIRGLGTAGAPLAAPVVVAGGSPP